MHGCLGTAASAKELAPPRSPLAPQDPYPLLRSPLLRPFEMVVRPQPHPPLSAAAPRVSPRGAVLSPREAVLSGRCPLRGCPLALLRRCSTTSHPCSTTTAAPPAAHRRAAPPTPPSRQACRPAARGPATSPSSTSDCSTRGPSLWREARHPTPSRTLPGPLPAGALLARRRSVRRNQRDVGCFPLKAVGRDVAEMWPR